MDLSGGEHRSIRWVVIGMPVLIRWCLMDSILDRISGDDGTATMCRGCGILRLDEYLMNYDGRLMIKTSDWRTNRVHILSATEAPHKLFSPFHSTRDSPSF